MTNKQIPRSLVNQLLDAALSLPTTEVCGLIGVSADNDTDAALSCYPIPNVAATPATRFELEPAAQIDAFRTMRERNEELFAIYHSHPISAPCPSRTDIADAAYPDALYLIVGQPQPGCIELRGFYLRGDTVKEVELIIEG